MVIISHTKTMTRTREDGKEEVFSACIKPDDIRYYGQDTDKVVRVLLLGGCASDGSSADSGDFDSLWIRQDSSARVGFFTTVKLD